MSGLARDNGSGCTSGQPELDPVTSYQDLRILPYRPRTADQIEPIRSSALS
jgi:hypothetical protein